MKRNDNIMLAYILFLLLCIPVSCVTDFPLWNAIVAAVTCSSWIFALADSKVVDVEDTIQDEKIEINFCEAIIKELRAIQTSGKERLQEISQMDEDRLQPHERNIRVWEISIDFVKECEENYLEKKSAAKKVIERAEKRRILQSILVLLGFLSFFCVLAFSPITQIAIKTQNQLTVFAFCVILLTQYLSSRSEEKRRSKKEKNSRSIEYWGRFHELLQELDLEVPADAD